MGSKYLFLLFIGTCANIALAQTDTTNLFVKKEMQMPKTQYIFNGNVLKINTVGLYVAPETGVATNFNEVRPTLGGSMMMIFNQKLAVGLNGQWTAQVRRGTSANQAGVRVEYTFKPYSKLHLTVPVTAGVIGQFDHHSSHRYNNRFDNRRGYREDYQSNKRSNNVVSPFIQAGLQLEANLTKNIKMYTGLQYRQVIHAKPDSGYWSGMLANLGMKIGIFDKKIHKKDSLLLKNKK